MIKNIFKILPWIIILILILILFFYKSCKVKNQQIKLFNATADSLHIEINKNGEQKASIELLTATSTKLFLDLKSKDSSIINLQNLVKQYKKNLLSATILNTVTTINTSSRTGGITSRDTMKIDSISYIYPEYRDTLLNKWYSANLAMNKDSSYFKFTIHNEYQLTQTYDKQKGLFGFMKPRIPTTAVLNLNPYTDTKELRTFTVVCECHNTRWFALGNVTGVSGLLLLQKAFKK